MSPTSSRKNSSPSRKLLEELTDKLISASKKHSSANLKYKQVPISSFYTKSQDASTLKPITKNETNIKRKDEVHRPKSRDKTSKSKPRDKTSKPKIRDRDKVSKSKTKLQKSPNFKRSKSQTINGWITKGTSKPKSDNNDSLLHVPTFKEIMDYKKDLNNYKQRLDSLKFFDSILDVSVENGNDKETNIKNKRYLNGSVSKYGVYVPSFEDYVDYKKEVENYKRCIESIDLEVSQESVDFNLEEPVFSTISLNCKHLSVEQLQEACERNYQYISDIFNGKTDSIRHKHFHKENNRNNFIGNDLNYNTSMITFTFEQKQVLLSFFYDKFNNGEQMFCQDTKYFFKVLLPELCTKIFMDTHNMDYKEAIKYLDGRPI